MVTVPDQYVIPSVQRAVRILQALAVADHPLGVSEISRLLQLPKSTVFRIVATLEREHVLERLERDRFRLGVSAFEIGSAYAAHSDLESAFRKVARRLVDEHNETAQLAILSGTDILYIAKQDCEQSVRLVSKLGSRLPAHATSLGKALLACLSEDELNELYPDGCLTALTPNSHTLVSQLVEDIRIVSDRGWAHDHEEVAVGLQCVGSAIYDGNGRPVAAISISIPSQRVTDERVEELGAAVMRAASEIGSLLGNHSTGRAG